MMTFHNLEEMRPYRRKEGYFFQDKGKLLDILLLFDFHEDCDLMAGHVYGMNITAWNLNVTDLTARTLDVNNLFARDIRAEDVDAGTLCANSLTCKNLHVGTAFAQSIDALDIVYTGFCIADKTFACRNILCMGKSPRHDCLHGQIQFKP